MKKRNKILTLISSVFGIVAICGIFACSCFGSRKNTKETKADDALTIIDRQMYFKSFTTSTISGTEFLINDITCSVSLDLLYESVDGVLKVRYYVTPQSDTFVSSDKRIGFTYNNIRHYVANTLQDYSYYSKSGILDDLPNTFAFRVSYFSFKHVRSGPSIAYVYNDTFRLGIQFSFDNFVTILGDVDSGTYSYTFNVTYTEGSMSANQIFTRTSDLSRTTTAIGYGGQTSPSDYFFMNIDYSGYTPIDESYAQGYSEGYQSGKSDGYTIGYNSGVSSAYEQAQAEYQAELEQKLQTAYQNGYSAGYNEGSSGDETALSIFSGILQVAMVPINFFLSIFNFEILGINLSAFIRALFTVAITVIVVKLVMGGSKGE